MHSSKYIFFFIFSPTIKFANQDYESLKSECQRTGILFEDREFIASSRILEDDRGNVRFGFSADYASKPIKWLRPKVLLELRTCKAEKSLLSLKIILGHLPISEAAKNDR